MKLLISVPTGSGWVRDEINDLVEAARAHFRARGWIVHYDRVRDRPTMACRNRQCTRLIDSPFTHMLMLDSDALPTDEEERPDVRGLIAMCEAALRDDVDIVAGWSLILDEGRSRLTPCVAHPPGTNPDDPTGWPPDVVSPYSSEPLVEITGHGVGAHCLLISREVIEAMRHAGRLPFDDVHDRDPYSPTWGGRLLGHDFAFTTLAADLGFRVWLAPKVFWGHLKEIDLRWFHDTVREMSMKIDSHAAVAQAMDQRLHAEEPPWLILRAAEEAAKLHKDGHAVCDSRAVFDVLHVLLGARVWTAPPSDGAIGLVVHTYSSPLPAGGEYADNCTLIAQYADAEAVKEFVDMFDGGTYERLGEGLVARCSR